MNKMFFIFIPVFLVLLIGCSNNNIIKPTNVKNVTPPQVVYIYDSPNASVVEESVSAKVVAEIKILDVKGYSIYISSSGFNMLIDTGSKDDFIFGELKKFSKFDYLVFTSNSEEKLGNAELVMLKFRPKIFETGIKNLELDDSLNNLSEELNLSREILLEPFYIQDEYLKVGLLTPYNSGFFQNFDDNSIIVFVKTSNSSILLMPTCGVDCQKRYDIPINNDFVLLPYKGDCQSIDLISILKYTKNATSVPSCNETRSKLEMLDYKILNYPISIKIYDNGGVEYG